jgi:hypothetical protein
MRPGAGQTLVHDARGFVEFAGPTEQAHHRGRSLRAASQCQATGEKNAVRLRVGDYRVILDRGRDTIEVRAVAHRREVYR